MKTLGLAIAAAAVAGALILAPSTPAPDASVQTVAGARTPSVKPAPAPHRGPIKR